MSDKKNNLVAILDAGQRTIIGKLVGETADILTLENPVVVNIVPQYDEITKQPTGQMALQLIPVFFREFQAEKGKPVRFEYNKTQITQIKIDGGFDFRLYGQHNAIFNQVPAPQSKSKEDTPVIKLFED